MNRWHTHVHIHKWPTNIWRDAQAYSSLKKYKYNQKQDVDFHSQDGPILQLEITSVSIYVVHQ